MTTADTIHAILDEEFADTGYPESAVERLLAIFDDQHQWGTRKTWTSEYGGHTEDEERTSEDDARRRIADWEWRQQRRQAGARITDFQLIRRAVGPWEVVES